MSDWKQAQEWERGWWGDCANTYGEETKQLLYAECMGLEFHHDGKSPYNIDLGGASVLDIGGGPVSLLLKCRNFGEAVVIDPLELPTWVLMRYGMAGVEFEQIRGEDVAKNGFDECWIYNVLQHAEDPARIIANARQAAKLVRLFEWVDTPTNEGHPHSLSKPLLDGWLKGEGKVKTFNGQGTCYGKAYFGIFPTQV